MRRRRRGGRVALDIGARRGPIAEITGTSVTDRLAEAAGVDRDADPQAGRVAVAQAQLGAGAPVPPEGVHAMTRGLEHLAGGLRHADLVLGALDAAGRPLAPGARALDFGCSSGRVVRALAAARPDVEWSGCDPNAGAVAWAQEHIPGVDVFVGPQDPPLPLDDASLDLVLAISIWSHYGADAAAGWLDEMRRVVRPTGSLILTFHGAHSLAFFARERLRSDELLASAAVGLLAEGHFFHDEFGPFGDEGVRHSQWGLAFMTLEWLAAHATPGWSIALFAPGAADGNQDVAVLRRP